MKFHGIQHSVPVGLLYRSLLWKLQRKSVDTFNLTFAKQSKAEQWHSWFCDCHHWLTPRCNAQRHSCTYIHIPPTRQDYVLHTPWFADPIVTILLSLHSLPWYFFYYCQLINTISTIPLLWCCKRAAVVSGCIFAPPAPGWRSDVGVIVTSQKSHVSTLLNGESFQW